MAKMAAEMGLDSNEDSPTPPSKQHNKKGIKGVTPNIAYILTFS